MDNLEETQPVINFTKLSDEILLKIFDFLSTYDILTRIALVCKQFYRLSKDASLIKEVHLNYKSSGNYTFLCELLGQSKYLNTLSLRGRSGPTEQLVDVAMKSCPYLRNLELKYCHLENECLESIVEYGRDLQSLNLEGTLIGAKEEGYNEVHFKQSRELIQKLVSRLKKLRNLNIRECNWFYSRDLITLARKCDKLESLNIEGTTNGRGSLQIRNTLQKVLFGVV